MSKTTFKVIVEDLELTEALEIERFLKIASDTTELPIMITDCIRVVDSEGKPISANEELEA